MKKIYFSRDEMYSLNVERLTERGVKIEDIAMIAYKQQIKYNPKTTFELCLASVKKTLSYRDIFHIVQLSVEIDRLTEQGGIFREPIQSIMKDDLGMFGIDEILGLSIAANYGVIGQTNFGDIDVNKPGIVKELNDHGKSESEQCHTFLDDVVGAIAAAASTRVAQIISEEEATKKAE
ncbi:MAG: phosphatidylglycerophosphatase A [Bacilli bacterium]|nr:phosphatidylglycerophosphatase A [Bacilli bacterium]